MARRKPDHIGSARSNNDLTKTDENIKYLSTSKIAYKYKKKSPNLFSLFNELGWIKKIKKKWKLTNEGINNGGIYKDTADGSSQYIVWPENILEVNDLFDLLNSDSYMEQDGMTGEDLIKLLYSHKLWIQSKGLKGERIEIENEKIHDIELEGIDLSGASFNRVIFDSLNLYEGNLSSSMITNCKIVNSILEGIIIKDANLSNNDLSGSNLSGAICINSSFRNNDFSSANLSNANLSNAILTESDFSNAFLLETNLSRADLSKATLTMSTLDEAILSEANLTSADCRGAKFWKAILNNALLFDADLTDADFSYATLCNADLSNANLNGAILIDTDLRDVNLEGSSTIGTQFVDISLKAVYLNNTLREKPNFELQNNNRFIFETYRKKRLLNKDKNESYTISNNDQTKSYSDPVVSEKPYKIEGEWKSGWAIDLHTLKSVPLGDGHWDTTRTDTGESLYRLKYCQDYSQIPVLSDIAISFLQSREATPYIDVIIPTPPSVSRKTQPVDTIALNISEALNIPLDKEYIVKLHDTSQLKDIDDQTERISILEGVFDVQDLRYEGKIILLFDDLFRSGSTLNEITRTLYNKGKVGIVYVLTLTKTRTKR